MYIQLPDWFGSASTPKARREEPSLPLERPLLHECNYGYFNESVALYIVRKIMQILVMSSNEAYS